MANIVRGDDEKWFIRLMQSDGETPYDLTGCTVSVTAKAAYDNDPADSTAIYQHWVTIDGAGAESGGSGLSLGGTDPATGTAYTLASEGALTQHLTDAETDDLSAGSHLWEIQLVDADDEVHTLSSGTETVDLDLTRKTSFP